MSFTAEEKWREYVDTIRDGAAPPFEEQWEKYARVFGEESGGAPPPAWRPAPGTIERSNLQWLRKRAGLGSYEELHAWSVKERAGFWRLVIERLGVVFREEPEAVLDLAGGAAEPRWLAGAEMNVADSCFAAGPGETAILSGREGSGKVERTTYGELERLVNRFANGLREHGFGDGDAIALFMPMTVECVAAYLGTVRAGCAVVSIPDSFSPEEVGKRLEIGRARALVTVDRFTRGGKTIPLYERARKTNPPPAVVIPSGGAGALREDDVLWSDFLGMSDRFDSAAGDPYRMTNILFSSGTTGSPKAIPWNHLTPVKCAMDGHFHQDIRPGDVVAWPTNIGWMMGPWLIYASLMNRATIALYDGLPAGAAFARFVSDAGVTMLGVVPSLVKAWRALPDVEAIDWNGIRVFSSTGEPSNRKDSLWLMSLTGYRAPVIEYCGGTEIGGGYVTGTVVQPASPATFTTPTLGLDFHLLDGSGAVALPSETGEVYLVPPSIGLSQSLLNGDHDAIYYGGCPAGPNGEVLRRHGDRMVALPGGYYKAEGRSDDTMNLGGIKVGSLELERVINSHVDVRECAAVGVQPEGEGPEKLVVFVVPGGSPDRKALLEELARLLAAHMTPLFKVHDLVFVDSLPRTASNKLMRRSLRARYYNEVLKEGKRP